MPIDKRIPRVLNSDLDNKAVDKVSMLDALNLYSGPDNEGFGPGGSKLDAGDQILKSIRGNAKVSEAESFSSTARLIGSVEDPKTDITYLFIFSTQGTNHGIWAYDRYGRLPGSEENSLRLIYKSGQFNFPPNGFVKADIVYSNAIQTFPDLGVDFDKDAIIYFTDGENEPRKINAYRAFEAGSNIHGSDVYAEADFITACPKTPVNPIEFTFGFDASRSTSNFTTTPGFQFAYQYVYIDGVESAISPYSDVAFPPSVVFQGSEPFANHNNYNACNLTIPEPGPEISSVKILAKQGSTGSFLIIDEIDIEDFTGNYAFYNDRIGTGVSQNEVNKQFDSVPIKAVTQGLSSNRLMYGNYTDGFDAVKTQCSAEVVYKDASESFRTFDIKINPSIEPIGLHTATPNRGKSVGFVLDFSEMPSELDEGVEMSLSLTIAPDRNWHLYSFSDDGNGNEQNSFQQTRQRGIQTQEGIDDLFNNVNFQQSFAETSNETGSSFLDENGDSFFGKNNGVGVATNVWKTVDSTLEGFLPDDTPTATYGTSAANPLIIKGGAVNFYAKIKTTQEITSDETSVQEKINQAFRAAFTGEEMGGGFTIENIDEDVKLIDSYNVDVGLYSGKRIKQAIINTENKTDSEAKLITAVGTNSPPTPPSGYFIVNKANVEIDIRPVDLDIYDQEDLFIPPTSSHFALRLKQINDQELYTCIHATSGSSEELAALDWIAISPEDILSIQSGTLNIGQWLSSKGLDPSLEFHQNPLSSAFGQLDPSNNIARQIGFLDGGNVLSTQFNDLGGFCLMDGEGGPGGGPSRSVGNTSNSYDVNKLYNQGSVTVNPAESPSFAGTGNYLYSQTVFYTGKLGTFSVPGVNQTNAPHATVLPLLFRVLDDGDDVFHYPLPEASDENSEVINPALPNFKRLQSPAEILSESFSISAFDQLDQRSFKTEANHDFGIVYYDERGRHGFVNPLTTVFVEGYTNAERPGGGKGAVEIKLTLNHAPPTWAHQYKIVYSKNTTVQDFVQYNAGGGFVSENLELQEISDSNQNIYVSLNYLQGHPVSYVSSFGARTPEGGLNLYKFQEGDKLRVISYFEGEERKYVDYEFDVVDLVKLGTDENPLDDDGENIAENLKGDFVVVKNNPAAFGFTHGETLSGVSNWGNNCIIELRTPLKDVDADQRVFYEMSDTYDVVINSDLNVAHDEPTLTLKNGDVWFRPVATNVREFENGQYVDIIEEVDGANDAPAQPNFKNVFLETSSATDLFRADNLGLGRPNFVLKGAKETVREATITYSEPSNPEGKRLDYSSFNASLANFKDLPERFGGIQYMSDYNEFLFVLQEDKVSVVPVNKSILSDASGSSMVIASTEVLGKAVFYPGQNGCDDDPSSVFDSGQEAYFCNKTLSKVYRWTKQGGVEEISDKGMSSVIRASIQAAIAQGDEVRIVGGYDPLKDEYLFTIINPAERTASNVVFVDQPSEAVAPGGGDGGDEGGSDDEDQSDTEAISVDPDSIDFGDIDIDTKRDEKINVFNNSFEVLYVSAVTSPDDSITFPGFRPFYMDPSQISEPFKSINVNFQPKSAGGFSSEIRITSSDPVNPNLIIPVIATVTEPQPEIQLSEFQQAWNDFYEANELLQPLQYPLQSDDDMSAQLAIDYLIDLKNADPSEHPTYRQMDALVSQANNDVFRASLDGVETSGSAEGELTASTADLLLFLGAFSNSVDADDSFFEGAAFPTTNNPATGGSTPPPDLSLVPAGLYNSVQDALDFIVEDASLTVGAFHIINASIKDKVKADFNGDGIIGTGDLMDLLQYYNFPIPGEGEPAFINPPQPDTEGFEAPDSQLLLQTVLWITQYGSDMTAAQYWSFASNIRKDVKTDINGDGIVGASDHLVVLAEWSTEQGGDLDTPPSGATTPPLDPDTLAFN